MHRTNANSHIFFLVIFGKRNPECNSEVCLRHGVSKAQMGGKPINLLWESIGLFFCCNCWRWVCPMFLLLHWKLQNQALALKMSFGYARSLKQKVVIFPFHPLSLVAQIWSNSPRKSCRSGKESSSLTLFLHLKGNTCYGLKPGFDMCTDELNLMPRLKNTDRQTTV